MIHFFSNRKIVFHEDYKTLSETSHLLVFEPTISGYRQVLSWLKGNPNERDVFRVVVPLNSVYVDVGDYLVSEDGYQDYVPSLDEHKIVPISREKYGTWPRKTCHAVFDFEQAKKYLEDHVLLPQAFSGLSRVQEVMITYTEKESCIHVTMEQFGITKTQALDAWEKLHQGQIKYTLPHFPFPHVVINGPYPLQVEKLRDYMISYINTGELDGNWSSIPIATLQTPHVGTKSLCKRDSQEMIISPPYGVSEQQFYIANAHLCVSVNPMKYLSTCEELTEKHMCWQEEFADGVNFASIDEYMKWWMNEMEAKMKLYRGEAEEEHRKEEIKREFIRTLYLGSQVESASGKLIRAFYDENETHKRVRIDRYYNNQQELLDTKVVEIESGQAMMLRNDEFFESGSDYWIHLLKQAYPVSTECQILFSV